MHHESIKVFVERLGKVMCNARFKKKKQTKIPMASKKKSGITKRMYTK